MNLYEILKVARNASNEDIKKAYRKRAAETHSDVGGSDEEFRAVKEAYDVLSDEEKRSKYDETGTVDKESFTTDRDKAHQVITSLLLNAVEQGVDIDTTDLFTMIGNKILKDKEVMFKTAGELKRKGEKCVKMAERIKRKDKVENFFSEVLMNASQQAYTQSQLAKDEMKKFDLILEMLAEYKYNTDERKSGSMADLLKDVKFTVWTRP